MSAQNFIEVKVSVKDEDQKLTKKFPVYRDNLTVSRDDHCLREMVEEVLKDFKGSPTESDVVVTIKYTW